jgi:putative oxidoreductase
MKKKIISILSILFGIMMVNSGLNKFLNYMPMPEMTEPLMAVFGAFMAIKWLMPLVALVEIAGGVLIAIPKTRALGAIVILPVMIGIVVHHLTHDVAGIVIGLVLFLINAWVIIENREKYSPMIK